MFGLKQNEKCSSQNNITIQPVEKRDRPLEISVLFKSTINDTTACMGIVLDFNKILTIKECSDQLR